MNSGNVKVYECVDWNRAYHLTFKVKNNKEELGFSSKIIRRLTVDGTTNQTISDDWDVTEMDKRKVYRPLRGGDKVPKVVTTLCLNLQVLDHLLKFNVPIPPKNVLFGSSARKSAKNRG